ncbi:MAG: hypothetical protein ACR2FG_14835, partial [Marmoricola sp.]
MVCALVLTACTGGGPTPTPDRRTDADVGGGAVINRFAAAWSKSERPDFRSIVDEPGVATADIAAHVAELGVVATDVRPVGDIDCGDDSCREYAEVTHELAGAGSWTYETLIMAQLEQGQWLVHWSAGTFQPDLSEANTLVLTRKLPTRAPILDRDGNALTPERAIVRVGVKAGKVTPDTYDQLRSLLDIDTVPLQEQVDAADPAWFVSVIDLRKAAYEPLREDLLQVPGISIDTAQRALAPTSEWGRAILG